MAGIFQYQSFKDSLLDELDAKLLEIADETYEIWYRERGVSWEDAIRETTRTFQSYQPLIQLVRLQDEEREKIEEVVHTTSIEEGSFLFDLEVIVLRVDNKLQHYWRDPFMTWHEGVVIGSA